MQTTKLLITGKRTSPFKTEEGEMRDYFWYQATRQSDGVSINFGSSNEYEEDDEVDIVLIKYERKDGKIGYKEGKA